MILIRICRKVLSFVNIAVRGNTLIFMSIIAVLLQNIGVRVTMSGPLSV